MNRFGALVAAVLWALAVSQDTPAASGRISFTGSVVVPTCGPGTLKHAASVVPQDAWARCPSTSTAASYTLRIEPAAIAIPRSRLLGYYDAYLRADGTSAWLATQVYD